MDYQVAANLYLFNAYRQIFLFLPFYQSYKQADVVLLAKFNFKPRPLQLPFVVFIHGKFIMYIVQALFKLF